MKGLTTVAKRAALSRLRSDPALTGLVPVAQIYPQQPLAEPPKPFVRLGAVNAVPRKATCLDGAVVTIDVSAFARGREVAGQLVETAEDHLGRIVTALERAIDGRGDSVTVDGQSARLSYRITDMGTQADSEDPALMHYFCTIRAKVTA